MHTHLRLISTTNMVAENIFVIALVGEHQMPNGDIDDIESTPEIEC